MNRRHVLQTAAATPLLAGFEPAGMFARALAGPGRPGRVRPGDPGWPSDARWAELGRQVGGRLEKVAAPLQGCIKAPSDATCVGLFKSLKNP